MTQVYLTQCGKFTATHGHGGTLNEAPHPHTFTYEITFHGPLNEEGYLIDFRTVQHALTRKISTARIIQLAVNVKFTKSRNVFCDAISISHVIVYPSLWLSIIAFKASASSSDNVSLPKNAAINPGKEPPKVRFTN